MNFGPTSQRFSDTIHRLATVARTDFQSHPKSMLFDVLQAIQLPNDHILVVSDF